LTAEIRARDVTFASLKIEKLSARLQPLTEEAVDNPDAGADAAAAPQPRELSFMPDPAEENLWRARFSTETRGRFALEIDYTAGGQKGHVEKRFAVVAPSSSSPQGAGLDTFRRAARERGGELVNAADTNALIERINATSSNKETVRRSWELRTWWPLAFLIPLLLSTEWFLRRRWRID
jgi:hypothetical protein